MGLIIIVLFIAVPIGEIAVFIEAGQRFGLWPTIGAIMVTAVIGTACIRIQGVGVLRRIQDSMARNETPLHEVLDGLCLLVAGALLLTPGFITDTAGFCLLFPPVRRVFGDSVAGRLVHRDRTRARHTGHTGHTGHGGTRHGPVIDGEFEDLSGADPEPDDRASRASRTRLSGGNGK